MELYTFTEADFAAGLKRARKAAHVTQQQLADAINVSLISVRNWEQGRSVPEWSTISQLTTLFMCDIDYLFNRIQCTTHAVQHLHDVTGLSEAAIRKLARIAEQNADTRHSDALSRLIEHDSFESILALLAAERANIFFRMPDSLIPNYSFSTQPLSIYLKSELSRVCMNIADDIYIERAGSKKNGKTD